MLFLLPVLRTSTEEKRKIRTEEKEQEQRKRGKQEQRRRNKNRASENRTTANEETGSTLLKPPKANYKPNSHNPRTPKSKTVTTAHDANTMQTEIKLGTQTESIN